ncbi:MAG: hypothetical protein PHT33_09595, partial [bacterium]|nr:hypothetical protein [bacterium]
MMKAVLSWLTVMLLMVIFSRQGFAQIKVGVYEASLGAKGIYEALKQEKGFETTFVKVMPSSVEELLKYDVLVIGSLR